MRETTFCMSFRPDRSKTLPPPPFQAESPKEKAVSSKTAEHGAELAELIQGSTNLEQLNKAAVELGNLVFEAEALVLLGNPESTNAAPLFRKLLSLYKNRANELISAGQPAPVEHFTVESAAATLLALTERLKEAPGDASSLTRPVAPLSPEAFDQKFKPYRRPNGSTALGQLPHRVLQARLMAYVAEHSLMESLSEEERDRLVMPETNDLGAPLMAEWEFDYERTTECDEATYEGLGRTYNELAERAEALIKEFRATRPTLSLAWLKAFEAYENDWMKFTLDQFGKVRLTGS